MSRIEMPVSHEDVVITMRALIFAMNRLEYIRDHCGKQAKREAEQTLKVIQRILAPKNDPEQSASKASR